MFKLNAIEMFTAYAIDMNMKPSTFRYDVYGKYHTSKLTDE